MSCADPEIVLTDDGFALCGAKEKVAVAFADVCVIRAEKIDLLTVDEIRVTFERKSALPLEVSEESLGFNNLMNRVLARFSGADRRWYEKVAPPPFARSPTLIWSKEEPNQPAPVQRP